MAPSRHDWKIVDWDVKPQHNQPTKSVEDIRRGSVYKCKKGGGVSWIKKKKYLSEEEGLV